MAAKPAVAWHTLSREDVVARLNVDRATGLTETEAAERIRTHGGNELTASGGRTAFHILWEQVSSFLILILFAAAGLAAFLGKWIDASAILAIVLLFVILGFVQEYRAQKAIAALKQMSAPMVRVLRGGRVMEVSSRALVPGDIVRLEAGNVVPADARVLESVSLRVQEAALTGESEPVEKVEKVIPGADVTVGDRKNMVYSGTAVTFGRGEAVVVETGMATELGKIASMIQTVKHSATPLQKRLDGLGKALAVIAILIAAVIVVSGMARGEDMSLVLLTGVSIAVAIVPEGLPAVLTFTLALGARRMLKRKALIRKLPAVETLGSVTVICSDKTGTLTQNRMTATMVHTAAGTFTLGEGDLASRGDVAALLEASALCNDAFFRNVQGGGTEAVGDPTETALIVAAQGIGFGKATLEGLHPRVAEVAFDSDRKRMSTIHTLGEGPIGVVAQGRALVGVTKGAPDAMMPLCTAILTESGVEPLDEARRTAMLAANDRFGGDGMRVLAIAARPFDAVPGDVGPETLERELVLLGLVAIIDPPRAEAADAVAVCRRAGIRPVMITGDHPLTARKIAADLDIWRTGDEVVTGVELERMSAEQLQERVETVSVFARVSPEHKLRIVEALQARGHVVAMTGDGVNDAPALKKADIGVAMGITGTDVSKEAADMVLLDDNFATIVAAVEEGRVVYDNVRRFVQFSIAGNVGKVMTVAIPPFFGLPLLLTPIQILFSNLLTDGLLGLGMGVEKAEANTMRRPPHKPGESIFARGLGVHVMWLGLLIGAITIGTGATAWYAASADGTFTAADQLYVGTMVFLTLALLQIGRTASIRSFREPVWKLNPMDNPTLLGMVLVAFVLQLAVTYVPLLQPIFNTTDIGWLGFAVGAGAAVVVLFAMEIEKAIRRGQDRAAARVTGPPMPLASAARG